ncbi:MAG: HAMP domain-containing histidine kinase [Bacteroidales bacterium]|nr:HAMP domain-containing histidine kinase [Bacteroidales bacterium]
MGKMLNASSLTWKNSTADQVYESIGAEIVKIAKNTIIVPIQLDEKLNKSFVFGIYGITNPFLIRFAKLINVHPEGRFFNTSDYGRENYFHDTVVRKYEGDVYSFSKEQIPRRSSKLIEFLLSINKIYTIGINYYSYPMGTVVILTRGNNDLSKQQIRSIQNIVVDASEKLYNIILANRRLLNIPEVKDRFTSSLINNITHEIRTPLNGIIGLLNQGMHKDPDRNKEKQIMKDIWECGQQLTNTIENLIFLSELETNTALFQYRKISLHDFKSIIADCINKSNYSYPKREVKLECTKQMEKKYMMVAEARIRKAVYELLNNALKFSEDRIEVKLLFTEFVQVMIKDYGIGMNHQELKNIFKNFSKHQSKERNFKGTGIGLSIAYNIIEKHNSKLFVQSQPNKGSEFYFCLPYAQC